MSTEIIKKEGVKSIAEINSFTPEQIELVKKTVAKNATDDELQMFLHLAKKYDLDPLAKQIWFIKYKVAEAPTIFTSRDGYLKIAHDSGQFDGLDSHTIDDEKGNPIKAICEIWRKDMSHSFKAEVKFKEYGMNNRNPIWRSYPSAMLIKVAEVFALKRAFSISGLVTSEEMCQEQESISVDQNHKNIKDGILNLLKNDVFTDEEKNKWNNFLEKYNNNEEAYQHALNKITEEIVKRENLKKTSIIDREIISSLSPVVGLEEIKEENEQEADRLYK